MVFQEFTPRQATLWTGLKKNFRRLRLPRQLRQRWLLRQQRQHRRKQRRQNPQQQLKLLLQQLKKKQLSQNMTNNFTILFKMK